MKEFKLKPTIVYDCDLSELNYYCNGKVMVICDPFFIKTKVIEKIENLLTKANAIEIFPNKDSEPTLDSVIEGLLVVKNFNPDTMLVIGGGSAIDLAKGIMYFDIKTSQEKEYKLIAVPTTSGSGSEVTSFTVISDIKRQLKIPIVNDSIIPNVAFLSEELTRNIPKEVIAYTAMDAFTHCLEAYVSINANHYSDGFVYTAIKLLNDNVIDLYKNETTEQRINVQQAATIAGLAFNEASLGINHAIAHQIGAMFSIPHGKCNAAILTDVIKLNSSNENACSKYSILAYELNLTDSLSKRGYRQLINRINKIRKELSINPVLRGLGISYEVLSEKVDLIAKNALEDITMKTNPVQLSQEEMIQFILELY